MGLLRASGWGVRAAAATSRGQPRSSCGAPRPVRPSGPPPPPRPTSGQPSKRRGRQCRARLGRRPRARAVGGGDRREQHLAPQTELGRQRPGRAAHMQASSTHCSRRIPVCPTTWRTVHHPGRHRGPARRARTSRGAPRSRSSCAGTAHAMAPATRSRSAPRGRSPRCAGRGQRASVRSERSGCTEPSGRSHRAHAASARRRSRAGGHVPPRSACGCALPPRR